VPTPLVAVEDPQQVAVHKTPLEIMEANTPMVPSKLDGLSTKNSRLSIDGRK
jgi:hypothetical protein